jgi:hypothetical protein
MDRPKIIMALNSAFPTSSEPGHLETGTARHHADCCIP